MSGASFPDNGSLPTSYLLHWHAITTAIDRGCHVFNSDAITGYNNNYILPENLAAGETNPWGTPTALVSPRFAQFSLQFNF